MSVHGDPLNSTIRTEAVFERVVIEKCHRIWMECEQRAKRYFPSAQLRKPSILLDTIGERRLGEYAPTTNRIRISRNLLFKYNLCTIVEVFKHEVAHQFAHAMDANLEDRETAHGPSFHKMCSCIGADPKASGGHMLIDDMLREAPDQLAPEDRITLKIRKLFSLATSVNKHEAELAMAKALALIRKYNLLVFKEDQQRTFFPLYLGTPKGRIAYFEYSLGQLLEEHYFVKAIWVSYPIPGKTRCAHVLEISGTPANLANAQYAYEFVLRVIDRQWRSYRSKHKLHERAKREFGVGIVEGFKRKLDTHRDASMQQEAQETTQHTALIKNTDPLLQEYFRQRYPRLRRIRTSGQNRHAAVYNDGKQQGAQLVIHKGVSETSRSRRHLVSGQTSGRAYKKGGET